MRLLVALAVGLCVGLPGDGWSQVGKYFGTESGGQMTWESSYTGWSPRYHTIAKAADYQLAFYSQIDAKLKIIEFWPDGYYQTRETHYGVQDDWDIVFRLFFGGDPYLGFYRRSDGTFKAYRVDAAGNIYFAFQEDIGDDNGETYWNHLVAGNWIGDGEFLAYSKAEGKGWVYQFSTDGSGDPDGLTVVRKHDGASSWQKSWDVLKPGDFNGDAYTDILFYNHDSGEAKLVFFNSSGYITGSQTLSGDNPGDDYEPAAEEWTMTPYSVVVVGDFGGGSQDDILVYDQEAREQQPAPNDHLYRATRTADGSAFGTFWLDDASGDYQPDHDNLHSNWQTQWTHVVSLDQGGFQDDLLFYSTQKTIGLLFVQVQDTALGANRASLSQAEVDMWTNNANRAYRGAGIEFTAEIADPNAAFQLGEAIANAGDSKTSCVTHDGCPSGEICVSSTCESPHPEDLNRYACSGDPDGLRDYADALAAAINDDGNYSPESIVVFVRAGENGNAGSGCASPTRDYVIMPQFENAPASYFDFSGSNISYSDADGNSHTDSDGNVKFLAHELAHFFDLAHTGQDPASPTTIYDYDYDSGGGTGFAAVYDTPPDHSDRANLLSNNRCDDNFELDVGLGYDLNPERHNASTSGLNCDLMYRLSPEQGDTMRYMLFSQRSNLLP